MKRRGILYYTLIFGFLVGIHNGHVALWQDGDPEPVKVYPYAAEMLPKADQEALRKGIFIPDQAQLNKWLEDFLS